MLGTDDVMQQPKPPSSTYTIIFNEILFKDQNLILIVSRLLG
jgi:hypothetical protein